MTSIRLVWPFLALAREYGRPDAVKRVAALFGLSEAELEDPDTRVPSRLVADLLARAVADSGNRDLGLFAARFVDGAHIGIAEYLARSRPTLRKALESGERYWSLLGDGAHNSFEVKGKLAVWRFGFDADVVVHEAAYEFAVAIGVLHARRITGMAELSPIEVHFTHPKPKDISRHQKLFRCKLRFSMPVTQVIMSAKFLEMRLPSAEPALGRLLERQADAMLERLPRSADLTTRVRSLLRLERNLREASAERIARRLDMSVRTLSRKLSDEDTSYRSLIDELRKHGALRELAQNARTITEIADQLGFASTHSFHRAFRRWTGTTAARYREQVQQRIGRSRRSPAARR